MKALSMDLKQRGLALRGQGIPAGGSRLATDGEQAQRGTLLEPLAPHGELPLIAPQRQGRHKAQGLRGPDREVGRAKAGSDPPRACAHRAPRMCGR